LQLQGTINAGKCFVIVNGQTEDNQYSPACDPNLQALADQLDHNYPAPTYMNGNDALAIIKKDANGDYTVAVDIFGQIGVSAMANSYGWSYVKDSTLTYTMNDKEVTATISNYIVPLKANDNSTSGPFWMAWSKDHSLIRKPEVTHGVTGNQTFNITEEWDTLPAVHQGDTLWTYKDIWTNLGIHNYGTGISEKTGNRINITIYPNPVTNNSFSVSASKVIKSVVVYNVIGKIIYSAENVMSKSVAVYLDNPSKGIYMVMSVFNDNTSNAHKVIIK
jgi:hypothetical protein